MATRCPISTCICFLAGQTMGSSVAQSMSKTSAIATAITTSPTSDQPSPGLPRQSEDCAIHVEATPKEDRMVPERLDGGTLWHLRAMPTFASEQVDASGGSAGGRVEIAGQLQTVGGFG